MMCVQKRTKADKRQIFCKSTLKNLLRASKEENRKSAHMANRKRPPIDVNLAVCSEGL